MKHSLFRSSSGTNYIVPFIIVTSCFALWGFANDITNPMVKAFSKIFRMTVTEGTLVQVAFYGGYFAMAVPAALYNAFKGNMDNGYAFAGANAFRATKIVSVKETFRSLLDEFNRAINK